MAELLTRISSAEITEWQAVWELRVDEEKERERRRKREARRSGRRSGSSKTFGQSSSSVAD